MSNLPGKKLSDSDEKRKKTPQMETTIIGQGYNLDANTSVAQELIRQFKSGRFKSFTCMVAFASQGGISALTEYILDAKSKGMNIRVVLGIDQNGTSKEALEEVLSWGVEAYVYHTDSKNIFHPKVYLFENEDIFTLIVGSSNLTIPGLVTNIECSLLVKDIKSNPVHKDFYEYWKSILDGTEENIYPITKELIDSLVVDKLVLSDAERAVIHEEVRNGGAQKTKALKFRYMKLQKFPAGFRPRKLKIKKDAISKNDPQKTIPIENEILIAEIGGGNRWRQVNFPLNIFQDFFGAQPGKNDYKIELRNIAKDGTLGDAKISPSVTVKSHNYRFEINCAETQGQYPGSRRRPIGIYVKLNNGSFAYQVLLPGGKRYKDVKKFLYAECKRPSRELRRAIVHVEALHAIYPEMIL